MPNLSKNTEHLLQVIKKASLESGATPYLHGDLALALSFDYKPANPYLVQIVLSHTDTVIDVNNFYNHLKKFIIINREIQNSSNKYTIVSFPYVIDFSLCKNFDPQKNDIAKFNTDQCFINLEDNARFIGFEMSDNLSITSLDDVSDWDISHILGFAHRVGVFRSSNISVTQENEIDKDIFSFRTPSGLDIEETIANLLTTPFPGNSFRFLARVRNGKNWLAERFLDIAERYGILLNEDVNLHNIITDKKIELLNIYSDFFRFKQEDSPAKRNHSILTYLKLLLDTPSLEIKTPYINRVSVLSNPTNFTNFNSQELVQTFATTGACCQSDGTCVETTDDICRLLRGVFSPGDSCSAIDCSPNIPGDCQYPPCPECDPEQCGSEENGGQPCCCCSSVDIVSSTKLQCHKQVIISCNKDGSGPGPDDSGVEQTFGDCEACDDICTMIINSAGPQGCSNPPDPTLPKLCCGELPDPWYLTPPTPCECDCARTDADGVCSLHCLTCHGAHAYCKSVVNVTGSNCAYTVNLEPGPECCGSPVGFDVIFVIDNSGSMGPHIESVRNGIEQFVDLGRARGILSRLGLVFFNDSTGSATDVFCHGWNTDGTLNEKRGQSYSNFSNPSLPGPLDYTTNVEAFKSALDIDLIGGAEEGNAATMFALNHSMPGAFGNVIVLVSDEIWPNINHQAAIDPSSVSAFANALNYKIFYVGPANGNETTAIQTGGNFYSLESSWTQIFEDISAAAGVFPSSCACVDFTPIPIIRDVGDPSDPETYFPQCECDNPLECLPGTDGELPTECYEIPISKCISPKTESQCQGICNVPFAVNVCGTTITITPTETNLTCCGSLQLGCECPISTTNDCPDYICCGAQCPWVDICDELAIPFPVPNYPTVESAQNDIWDRCIELAISTCGDDCLEFPTGECEDDGTPKLYYVTKDVLDQEVAVIFNNCGGSGGACCVGTECSIVNSEAECDGVWMGIGSTCTPNPCGVPGAVDFECSTSTCDYDDQCIVGEPELSSNRIQDQCDQISVGCINVRNPAIALLNNGVGLVAYESTDDDITAIKLQQFHTSVDYKLLANRIFGYGRLQNSSRWQRATDPAGYFIATLWVYDEPPSEIIQGTMNPTDTSSWQDVVIFGSGPLGGGCFPIYANDPTGYDDSKRGWYLKFLVQINTVLKYPFITSDDIYNTRWYIYDYQTALRDGSGNINTQYLNLVGGAGSSGQDYPNGNFLFSESAQVDNLLLGTQITHHIYNGQRVPVANPSLSVTKNYQNGYENSHYVSLAYQALEDGKWNVYLKQIRLSEYSRAAIMNSIMSNDLLPVANSPTDTTPGLGLTDIIYKIVCVSDNCTDVGNNEFLLQRLIVMEATLPDGRELLNPNFTSGNWGSLCPGTAPEQFPKNKVFVRFVQSAVGDRCPDQFQFDDIFQNWSTGQEYTVPISVTSAQQLFAYLQRPNDSGIGVGQFDPSIEQGETLISSSSVGAEWFDLFDTETNNWSVVTGDIADTLYAFKGFDISDPVLISQNETGHATNPVVQVDYDNNVFITYEHTDHGTQQIRLVGTKYPENELPTGVGDDVSNPDNRETYFLNQSDFVYLSNITTQYEGVNQLPDLHVDLNNVVHIVWQSNRDRNWEIYYANSTNNFLPKRITSHDGRSLKPNITSNAAGNLFITWHDNRMGNYEIYMAYHPGVRIIPLYQQDPYLASLRNFHDGWSHTTDVLPLLVENNTDGPVCYTKFDVNFYEDRTLERLSFTVSSEDYPFAFVLPGSESDVTVADLSDLSTDWISTSYYDYVDDEIVRENFVAVSKEIDTFLENSSIKNIQLPQLNVSGGCSFGGISLRASNIKNDPDASNQWTADYSLIGKEGALVDLEGIGVVDGIDGRYKQIRLSWSCDVTTDSFSISDYNSDADVENGVIWENDRLELRLGLDPTSTTDWGEATLPSVAGGHSVLTGKYQIDLVEASGKLYIGWYYNTLSGGTVYVGELNNSTGEIENTTTILSSNTSVVTGVSMAEISGFPAISYSVRSLSTSPVTSVVYFSINRGTWEHNTVLSAVSGTVYNYPVLINYSDDPVIFIGVTASGLTALKFLRSTTFGQSWSTETVAASITSAEYSATIISNSPAVTYKSSGSRVYRIRTTGAWGAEVTMTIDGDTPAAQNCSLVDYYGNALFFYRSDAGIGLRWAQYSGSAWTGNEDIDFDTKSGFYKPVTVNGVSAIAYLVESGSSQVDLRIARVNNLLTNLWDIETISTNVEATSTYSVSIAQWGLDKIVIAPLADNPVIYLEDFDTSGIKSYDTYLRFSGFNVPVDTTIVTAHIDLTSRTISGPASSFIRLLNYYNVNEFYTNTEIVVPVQGYGDDAEIQLPDLWNVGSNSVKFGDDGVNQFNAYLRFPLSIPKNSQVIESYITLKASANNSGTTGADISLVNGDLAFADTYVYTTSVSGQDDDADYSTSSDSWNNERWNNSSEVVRFGEDGNETYESYLRFYITNIPTYAVISSAKITVEAANTVGTPSDINIKLLDYGDILSFPDTVTLQFPVESSDGDADFETLTERWDNNNAGIRFGQDSGTPYDAYIKVRLDINPDSKYIASRLRLSAYQDSAGSSAALIYLLEPNDDYGENYPLADISPFTTWTSVTYEIDAEDDDAHAEVIDGLPKKWVNDDTYVLWGLEHASDGDHTWDGYLRFDLSSGVSPMLEYVTVSGEGGTFARPPVNSAYLTVRAASNSSPSSTRIYGINRNVRRGNDGFPNYSYITAEVSAANYDADLLNNTGWSTEDNFIRFGLAGSSDYKAFLRFKLEDKDSSITIENRDYISESYLLLESYGNSAAGSVSIISRTSGCTPPDFVESTTLISEVLNAYDTSPLGLSDDADYNSSTQIWNNKEEYLNFGAEYEAYIRIRTSLSDVNIVSATLYLYPQSAELSESDLIVGITSDSNEDAYPNSDSKSIHSWYGSNPPSLAYSVQKMQTLNPSADEDDPEDSEVVSGSAQLGDKDVCYKHVLGDPNYPFADGSTTNTREYGTGVRCTGGCVWTNTGLWTAWVDNDETVDAPNYKLRVSKFDYSNNRWTSPQTLDSEVYGEVSMLTINNLACICYLRERDGKKEIYFVKQSGTGVWQSPVEVVGGVSGKSIGSPHCIDLDPDNSGEPAVFYVYGDDGDNATNEIYWTSSVDGGSTWDTPSNTDIPPGGVGGYASGEDIKHTCLRAAYIDGDIFIGYSRRNNAATRDDVYFAYQSGSLWADGGRLDDGGFMLSVSTGFDLIPYNDGQSDHPTVPLYIGRNYNNIGIRWSFTPDYGSTWITESVVSDSVNHDAVNVVNPRATTTEEDGSTTVSVIWTENDSGTYGVRASRIFSTLWNSPADTDWSQIYIAQDIGSDKVETVPVCNVRNRIGVLLLQPKASPSTAWDNAPVFYWLPRVRYCALIRLYAEELTVSNDYNAPFNGAIYTDSNLVVLSTDSNDLSMNIKFLDTGFVQPWTVYESGLSLPDTLSQLIEYTPVTWTSSSVCQPEIGDFSDLLQEWSAKYGAPVFDWIGISLEPSDKTERAGGDVATASGVTTSFSFTPAGIPDSSTQGFDYTWTYASRDLHMSAPISNWNIGAGEWQGSAAIGVDVTDIVDYFVNTLGSSGYMGFVIADANSSSGTVKKCYSVEHGSSKPYLEVVYSNSPLITYSGSVAWSPGIWSDNDIVTSPNIASIVQDFTNNCNPDFSDIAIVIRPVSGLVLKSFVAYDGVGYGTPPQLFVEYSSYIDVSPFTPTKSVTWNTTSWTIGQEYSSPDIRTIVDAWVNTGFFNPPSKSYIGFRVHTDDDNVLQIDSKDGGYATSLTIEYSPQKSRNYWTSESVEWNDSTTWDSGGSSAGSVIESPDLMPLINTLFTESDTFRYDYDPIGEWSSGVGYYKDSDHTQPNPNFTGQEIGFVIKNNSSSILREFESYDSNPSNAAILEIDLTEDGQRSRYLNDSSTEHPGVNWTATGWVMSSSVDTVDIAELIEEYLEMGSYDPSGSYIGIVFENNDTGNPLKQFYSYDSAYGGAQLEINWTTGGALPPVADTIVEWVSVDDFVQDMTVNTPDISQLVEIFLSSSGYSGTGYVGFSIADSGSSLDVREFYAFESGDDPAELFIHYSGPVLNTVGSINWDDNSTPALGAWAVDQVVSTPELSSLVQTYIDLPGYSALGNIGFVIEDNGSENLKSIYSYETSSGPGAAELYVSYRHNFDFDCQLNSLATSRLCLGPGESSAGSLDLTPHVRVDSNGERTVEIPLPVDYLTNWTYFTAIEATTSDGNKVALDQKTSVSCLSCSSNMADSTWDHNSCSLSIEIPNNDLVPRHLNVAVRFYADQQRNDLALQMSTFSWGDARQFTLANNQSLDTLIDDGQIIIAPGDVLRIFAWPQVDQNHGLLCGVKYYYTVYINDEGGQIPNKTLLSGEWTCSCDSGRVDDDQQNIQLIQRWRSSGEGLVDTRLTETKSDNLNPVVQIRPDNVGIVMYESSRDGVLGLYVSAFSYRPSYNMYASATESIISPFNQLTHKSDIPVKGSDDKHIAGVSPEFEFDLYGNIFMTSVIPFSSELITGSKQGCNNITPNKANYIKIHRCGLNDFNFEDIQQQETEAKCVQEDITRKVYAINDPVFNKTVNLIRVRDEFVQYHVTRNRAPMPVVGECNIGFEVIGIPESVAIRLRNSDSPTWGAWLPFDAETGLETISIDHQLSPGSGIKHVELQVASVAGVSSTATITILADYRPIPHIIRFYRPEECSSSTPCPPDPVLSEHIESTEIWAEKNRLNLMENMPVASMRRPEVTEDSGLLFKTSEYIFIEIEPDSSYFKQFTEEQLTTLNITPTFDFIHQGGRDEFNLPTVFIRNSRVFRGWITINKEDKGAFQDGLAHIIVHFKGDCSDADSVSPSINESIAGFTTDEFNTMVPGSDSVSITDMFANERDKYGRIIGEITIRPSDDPYFVFGHPDYRLKQSE